MPYVVFTVVQAWQELQSHIECQKHKGKWQSCATDINMLCAAAGMQQGSSHSINVVRHAISCCWYDGIVCTSSNIPVKDAMLFTHN